VFRKYQENAKFWREVTFMSWLGGVNYHRQQENGNNYFEEIYGYLLILVLLVLERKGQVWLRNKLGYEGSFYQAFKGKIRLEKYGTNVEEESESSLVGAEGKQEWKGETEGMKSLK
jgi:hypothetical protein